jgi:RNA polymerase sigma factor (sigma-70 family)
MQDIDEHRLLRDYVETQSEAAFASLTNHYIDLVYSAALRRVESPEMAEEVAQTVFILLARKAGALSSGVVLAGWLYRTTLFTAGNALRAEYRRQRREQEAFEMHQISNSVGDWHHLAPVLDEAMEQLNGADRDILVLRFFQHQPFQELATALKTTEDAAKKRVARALEKLRVVLSRRGISLTGALLALLLGRHGAQAAPAGLGASIAAHVFSGIAVSTTTAARVPGVLSKWRRYKARFALGLGLIVGLIFLFLGMLLQDSRPQSRSITGNPTINRAYSVSGLRRAEQPDTSDPSQHLAFRVIDAISGEGLPRVRIIASYSIAEEGASHADELTTDADGNCAVSLPIRALEILRLDTVDENHLPGKMVWRPDRGYPVPESYVLRLERGVHASGIVRDELGNPLAGVSIGLDFTPYQVDADAEKPGWGPISGNNWIMALTDSSGVWSTSAAPTNVDSMVLAYEPYHQTKHISFTSSPGPNEKRNREDIYNGTFEVTLERDTSSTLQGWVLDEQLHAIAGAEIYEQGWQSTENPAAVSTNDGSFIVRCGPTERSPKTLWRMMVVAEGFAPEWITADTTTDPSPVKAQLHRTTPLQIQVVNELGEPMKGVLVFSEANDFRVGLPGRTDENGFLTWWSQPKGEVTLDGVILGFEALSKLHVKASDLGPCVLTLRKLPPPVIISGLVVDQKTRKSVDSFEINLLDPIGLPIDTHAARAGRFEIKLDSKEPMPSSLRVAAEGYEPAIGMISTNFAGRLVCDIELSHDKSGIRGLVLQPDGKPAASTEIILRTSFNRAILKDKHLEGSVMTDADGRFVLPAKPGAMAVIAAHESGFGCLPVKETDSDVRITLKTWGRIEGQAGLETEPGGTIAVEGDSRWGIYFFDSALIQPDAARTFVFDRVPPGDCAIYLRIEKLSWVRRTEVQVLPGQVSMVQLSNHLGRRVVGRFMVPSLRAMGTQWFGELRHWPPGESERHGASSFLNPGSGLQIRKKKSFNFTANDSDGSFALDQVPPGSYYISEYGRGSLLQEIVITDAPPDSPDAVVDLGTIVIDQ